MIIHSTINVIILHLDYLDLVNGLTFILSSPLTTFPHPHTHSYTGRSCHARCQLHISSNMGFSILLKDTSAVRGELGFEPATDITSMPFCRWTSSHVTATLLHAGILEWLIYTLEAIIIMRYNCVKIKDFCSPPLYWFSSNRYFLNHLSILMFCC